MVVQTADESADWRAGCLDVYWAAQWVVLKEAAWVVRLAVLKVDMLALL
jgi:hypothetical protein